MLFVNRVHSVSLGPRQVLTPLWVCVFDSRAVQIACSVR